MAKGRQTHVIINLGDITAAIMVRDVDAFLAGATRPKCGSRTFV